MPVLISPRQLDASREVVAALVEELVCRLASLAPGDWVRVAESLGALGLAGDSGVLAVCATVSPARGIWRWVEDQGTRGGNRQMVSRCHRMVCCLQSRRFLQIAGRREEETTFGQFSSRLVVRLASNSFGLSLAL